MKIKLDASKMRHIVLFERITGATVLDCIEDEEDGKLTFVVKKGDMGKAMGKRSRNLDRVRRKIGDDVDVVEHSNDPLEFLKNIFFQVNVKNVEFVDQDNGKIAVIEVEEGEKGRAIGRGGRNIKRAKELAPRHHDILDVTLK